MAAFFTGVVRAPLTGIVLVVEMTANVTMLLPMLGACFMAMLAPTLMRDPPIYDLLRERTLERERTRLKQEERVTGKSALKLYSGNRRCNSYATRSGSGMARAVRSVLP